ncbi:MAG: carboxypeptidase-like regulatory domain-containing protein [Planctomycetaceae bacterium]
MAGSQGVIKDVELTTDGTLYGQVVTPQGQTVTDAVVQLRYNGTAIAAARSNPDGRFAISGVRGGAHEVVVGAVHSPVRLWASGAAPKGASTGIVVAADETIIRGQDPYCDTCPPGGAACGPTGFGMLDVITLATVGAAVGALVVGIDNNKKLKNIKKQINNLPVVPASP